MAPLEWFLVIRLSIFSWWGDSFVSGLVCWGWVRWVSLGSNSSRFSEVFLMV